MQYIKMKDATAAIAVNGAFELCVLPFLQDELSGAFSAGCTKVIVDLAATTAIDSASLGYLVDLLEQVGAENIKAVNLAPPVYQAFEANHLLRDFDVQSRAR